MVEIWYGGFGVMVFFEVVLQEVFCDILLFCGVICFNVCECYYDCYGLKVGELGLWYVLVYIIEGYMYVLGVCNVLCVKCYVSGILVGDVYVFDMVVELYSLILL